VSPEILPDSDPTERSRALAVTAARAADSKKATDVVVLEVGPIIGICDEFVICSASNPRLVAAVAQEIEDHLAIEFDRRPMSVEGLDDRRWVLVDYGDVVVHVFADEERAYYRLERLYGDAARVEWQPAPIGDTA
jgi:ribosome-associated protein